MPANCAGGAGEKILYLIPDLLSFGSSSLSQNYWTIRVRFAGPFVGYPMYIPPIGQGNTATANHHPH